MKQSQTLKKGAHMNHQHNHIAFTVIVLILFCPLLHTKEVKKEVTEKKENTAPYDEVIYNWSRTFAEVLQLAGQKHYKIQDAEKCFHKSIGGFLNCLDPHSGFLEPKTYNKMIEETSGEFFGIGVVIDNTRSEKDKAILIINTIPGGPSDKAGIQALDKIVEIDGDILEGMSTEEATSKLRGERNSSVTIKVLREGHPDLLSFDITRDIVKEQSSLSFYVPQYNIYYVSLTTFADNSAQQLEKLLNQASAKQYKGLILDLRSNTGGLLTSAINIAGLFLEKGSLVVSIKGKADERLEEYKTDREPAANNSLPVFILINNYTASAAEILSGCLKIHSNSLSQSSDKQKNPQKKLMIFLVGTKSFGKGSVQEVIPISNNCAIKLTTSLYYLPEDTLIQGKGIEPDFVIERMTPPTEKIKWFTEHHGREQNLSGFINTTEKKDDKKKKKKEDKKHKTWAERVQEMLNQDNQFKTTINLINLLDIAKKCHPNEVNNRHKAIAYLQKHMVTDQEITLEEVKG